MIEDKSWDDAVVGQTCTSPEYEVTEARVMAYADLTGDHSPVHTNGAYAKTTPFGMPIADMYAGMHGVSA